MNTVTYDGSFEGLLTAIFEIYEYKIEAPGIVKENSAHYSLFSKPHHVFTDGAKAERVHNKLKQSLSANGMRNFFAAFLSEKAGIENALFDYARMVFAAPKRTVNKYSIEKNYSSETVLQVEQTSKKVYRERHRMEAFVRFKLTADGLYYAVISPDFNVIPLLVQHFEKRYTSQRWLIYDMHRKYGIYYDLQKVEVIQMDDDELLKPSGATGQDKIHHASEQVFQQLWQKYFSSVNIKARKNTKLHVRHMPKRYWRYLTEKVI